MGLRRLTDLTLRYDIVEPISVGGAKRHQAAELKAVRAGVGKRGRAAWTFFTGYSPKWKWYRRYDQRERDALVLADEFVPKAWGEDGLGDIASLRARILG